jgi:predicted metalloendopeptidase
VLSGMSESEAKQGAEVLMAFESKLASISLKRVERRNPVKTYNKVSGN